MKLYHLESKETNLWSPWYDKAFAFVVRAKTVKDARQIASLSCGDEGKKAWLSPYHSTCKELKADGPEETIIRDFARG